MRVTFSCFCLVAAVLTCHPIARHSSADTLRGPSAFKSGDNAPDTIAEPDENAPLFGGGETFMNSACFIWLKFYQNFLSLLNTVKCPMTPTCSNYSIQAVRKHGAVKGVVLTAGRLLHEMDEQRLAPRVMRGNRVKFRDPVENNDFWWSDK